MLNKGDAIFLRLLAARLEEAGARGIAYTPQRGDVEALIAVANAIVGTPHPLDPE